jgi:pimeloyl-ACP methyl ester carboxylesterase
MSTTRASTAAVTGAFIRVEQTVRRATGSSPRPDVHRHEGGSGRPLVLLNGFAASGLLWPASWVRELELGYRVIRIDNRGTGWSRDAPAPFTITELADDVAAVLDDLGYESATVLGLSMGGMIAQEFAIRYPQRVDRLYLVSTIAPAPASTPATGYLALLAPALGRTRHRESAADFLARFYLGTCSHEFRPAPEMVHELAGQLRARPRPSPAYCSRPERSSRGAVHNDSPLSAFRQPSLRARTTRSSRYTTAECSPNSSLDPAWSNSPELGISCRGRHRPTSSAY